MATTFLSLDSKQFVLGQQWFLQAKALPKRLCTNIHIYFCHVSTFNLLLIVPNIVRVNMINDFVAG